MRLRTQAQRVDPCVHDRLIDGGGQIRLCTSLGQLPVSQGRKVPMERQKARLTLNSTDLNRRSALDERMQFEVFSHRPVAEHRTSILIGQFIFLRYSIVRGVCHAKDQPNAAGHCNR